MVVTKKVECEIGAGSRLKAAILTINDRVLSMSIVLHAEGGKYSMFELDVAKLKQITKPFENTGAFIEFLQSCPPTYTVKGGMAYVEFSNGEHIVSLALGPDTMSQLQLTGAALADRVKQLKGEVDRLHDYVGRLDAMIPDKIVRARL